MPNIIFDRDGTLIKEIEIKGKLYPPFKDYHLEIVENAYETLMYLKDNMVKIYLCSNQPYISRGMQLQQDFEKVHKEFNKQLPFFDGISYCFHSEQENCRCRKPKPGLINKILSKANLKPEETFVVGDRWVDILAGKRAGCTTILIDSPNSWNESTAGKAPRNLKPDHTINEISDLVASDILPLNSN